MPYTYPPPAPSISGDTVTISRFLQNPTLVARRLRTEHQATQVIMVGDGASDLEVKGDADKVIGFGRYAVRAKVKAGADAFITSLDQLPGVVG